MGRADVTRVAERDLEEIWLYIARENVEAADRHLDRLSRQFQNLGDNPLMGCKRDDLSPGVRSLPMGNYVIFYQPGENGVLILRVIEGHRDITPEYFEE